MPEFCLPDLGEGLTEAEIISWRVQVGDRVATDQVVAEVETAKAAVELPVPYDGVVTAVHARAGQVLPVGAPLLTVEAGRASRDGVPTLREPGVTVADMPVNGNGAAPGNGSGSGSVLVGYGTSDHGHRRRRHTRPAGARAAGPARDVGAGPGPADGVPAPGQALAAGAKHDPAGAEPAPGRARAAGAGRVPVSSPLVRRMARDAGIDVAGLPGSGPSGLVLRRDVEQAIARRRPAPPAGHGEAGGVRRIPLHGRRKAAADKLSLSRREIPEATVWVDVDATELLDVRRSLNARQPDRPVSVLALIARFAVLGLRRHPELNGRIDQDDIVVPDTVHLGFAAQTPRGLVVPVVHDAHLLSARDLTTAIGELAQAARAGASRPPDLAGGTFTVNNYGVFGVDGSAAIINYPEAAILGFGRIIDRPWIVDGQVMARKLCQLSLVFDHRVCDGGTAGGFLRFVADCVESPVSALGDL